MAAQGVQELQRLEEELRRALEEADGRPGHEDHEAAQVLGLVPLLSLPGPELLVEGRRGRALLADLERDQRPRDVRRRALERVLHAVEQGCARRLLREGVQRLQGLIVVLAALAARGTLRLRRQAGVARRQGVLRHRAAAKGRGLVAREGGTPLL